MKITLSHMKITLLTENARKFRFANSFQPIQLPHQLLSSDEHQEHGRKERGCSTNSEQAKWLRTSQSSSLLMGFQWLYLKWENARVLLSWNRMLKMRLVFWVCSCLPSHCLNHSLSVWQITDVNTSSVIFSSLWTYVVIMG